MKLFLCVEGTSPLHAGEHDTCAEKVENGVGRGGEAHRRASEPHQI